MDNPSVQNVTDTRTVTNVSTASIVPTDSATPTEITSAASICNEENVTNVTKRKETRKVQRNQADRKEAQQLLQMRWWFFFMCFVFCILWMIAMVGVSIFVFYLSRNFFSLLISAASAPALEFMRRFSNYLLPMDDKRFFLAQKKIEMKAKKAAKGEQIHDSKSEKD